MKLENCATVTQGVVISRFETIAGTDATAFSLYTVKEMSDSLGFEYHGSIEKLKEVHISNEKMGNLPLTKEGALLINLTSHRAVTVRPKHIGRLIPSNFVVIEPKEFLDPYYLEWYINEHPDCRKQLKLATQGAVITALSIQMLRSLVIQVPSMNQQKKIKKVYMSIQQKKKLLNERIELEEKLVKHILKESLSRGKQ